jgi:hypothetical protein
MLRIGAAVCLLLVAAVGFLWRAPTVGAQPRNSEQVVFSGVTFGTFAGTSTPNGFWIWCEADSTNPYQGECAGSLRFDNLGVSGITKGVHGAIEEIADGQYQIEVWSNTDDSVHCTYTNTPPAVHGPKNTVTAECSAPVGSGSSNINVVNVTGPPAS